MNKRNWDDREPPEMYSFVFVGKPTPSNNLRTDRFSTNKTRFCARTNFKLNRGGILLPRYQGSEFKWSYWPIRKRFFFREFEFSFAVRSSEVHVQITSEQSSSWSVKGLKGVLRPSLLASRLWELQQAEAETLQLTALCVSVKLEDCRRPGRDGQTWVVVWLVVLVGSSCLVCWFRSGPR